ncbi:MAG TPA: Ig-like domain-containing protein [Vicinamibacterales bacterium]|nr:Ig-like domain-containing protein [Vicinamibacterales bacterium]
MAQTRSRALADALIDLLALAVGFAVGAQVVGVVHAARVADALTATTPGAWVLAPADGDTLSGQVQISAGATADIASLQFQLNGVNLGPLITSGACAVNWNTEAVVNGAYAVSVLGYDGVGNPVSSPATSVTVANALLRILSVATSGLTSNSATIAWTTNQPATSTVSYGILDLTTASDLSYVTQHSMVLTGLSPGSSYHFTVTSSNGLGASATSDDAVFATAAPPPPPPPSGPPYTLNGVAADAAHGVFANTLVLLGRSGRIMAVTMSDAAGRFSFTGLTAGTYSVSVPLPGTTIVVVILTKTLPN